MDRQAIIDRYTADGYILFPLQGKIPPKGYKWSEAQFNPLACAADFPDNFGVKLAKDDFVIDIDPCNFPADTKEYLKKFQAALNFQLKDATFTVKTGGGGLHLYFKKDAQLAVRGGLKEWPGIEFKTAGQYVVAAGGIHPDTKRKYTIYSDKPVAQAPTALLGLLKRSELVQSKGTESYTQDAQTIDRYKQYLKTAPVAIEGESGDKTTFTVAAVGHDFGIHPDTTYALMEELYNAYCQPPWTAEELKRKVYNAYQYSNNPAGNLSVIEKFDEAPILPEPFRQDQYGRLKKELFNVVNVFNTDMPEMLAFNSWSENIIFRKPAPWHVKGEMALYWTDKESTRCKFWISKTRLFEPSVQLIEEGIENVARQKCFHPIKQYLEGLKWDGHARLATWLHTYMGVDDNAYTRAVGLKTLVAAIARIYEPGIKFDYIPVIEGAQGLGKSQALKILGGKWYGDITLNVHKKDTIDDMRRFWILEVSEMETTYRTETQALKSFLSRSVDIARLAYGRTSREFPRQSIFIGTINPEKDDDVGYLKDTTGNRRFWPFYCKRIDLNALRVVRDQLWAEALIYYRNNTALHFEDVIIEQSAIDEQTKRLGNDPWYDKIAAWVDCDFMKDKDILSSHEIYTDCLGGKAMNFDKKCQSRIGYIMLALNWMKGVHYEKELKIPKRGYRRPLKP